MTLLHHPDTHKLGKLPAKPPKLYLADYVHPDEFSAAPATVSNTKGESTPLAMYANDKLGDCTCAAIGNTLRVNSDGAAQVTEQSVIDAYVAVTTEEGAPYDPATGANADAGCIPLDVLRYWCKTGIAGHKLTAFAGIDVTNLDEVRWALWRLGSVYFGVLLDVEQQSQEIWDVAQDGNHGTWGGHLFPIFDHVQYDHPVMERGLEVGVHQAPLWTGGTWGAYKQCTDAFITQQGEEGHGLITQEFIDAHKDDPAVNTDALEQDLKLLRGET